MDRKGRTRLCDTLCLLLGRQVSKETTQIAGCEYDSQTLVRVAHDPLTSILLLSSNLSTHPHPHQHPHLGESFSDPLFAVRKPVQLEKAPPPPPPKELPDMPHSKARKFQPRDSNPGCPHSSIGVRRLLGKWRR